MGKIRNLVLQHIDERAAKRDLHWLEAHRGAPPKLFPSSLGGCPRAAFYSAYRAAQGHPWYVEKTHPFDTYLLEKFKYGDVWEDVTYEELLTQLPGRVIRNVAVSDDIWTGRIDFLVGQCEQFPNGAIVEHKTTATWNFTYSDEKRRLPFESHCYQTLAYKYLFQKEHDMYVSAYLYYRSANNTWAEFNIATFGNNEILWDGEINGHAVYGSFQSGLRHEMERFESYWHTGELPPKYSSPTEKDFGCTKKAKGNRMLPACQFFGVCWDEKDLIQCPF